MDNPSFRQDNFPAVMARNGDAVIDPYQLGIESSAFRAFDAGAVNGTSADNIAPYGNSGAPSDLGRNLDGGAHVISPLNARGNSVSGRSDMQ